MISCAMTVGGASSSAIIDVMTNGPPLPGLLVVQPHRGVELTTPFVLSGSQWLDPDLPLSYAFFFFDPLTGARKTIQGRTELSYARSTFPAGKRSSDYFVVFGTEVFDSFDALSTLTSEALRVTELGAYDTRPMARISWCRDIMHASASSELPMTRDPWLAFLGVAT